MKKLFSAILVAVLLSVGMFTRAGAKDASLGAQKIDWYGNRDFLWPVPATHNISSCFFDGRGHYAIDIGVSGVKTKERNVVASYDGVVHWVKYSDSGFGNSVMLKHEYTTFWGVKKTLYTHYGHLDSISVKKNQPVTKGQTIGVAGDTGDSHGPHLDFMILTQPKPYDGERNTYSLDPYANFLLELPNDVYRGGSTSCCDKYIKAIKTLYKDYTPQRLYLEGCTSYNANGYIKITTATTIKSLPCSRDTYSQSTDVRKAKKNERYRVIGLYKNTAGNYWYQVGGQVNSNNNLTSAVTGYIYAGNAMPVMNGWTGFFSLDGTTASQSFSSVFK